MDGDCVDDLTELDALGTMNPVNPAPAIDLSDGVVAVPDQATLADIAHLTNNLKFVLFGLDNDRPGLYFINGNTHPRHPRFFNAVGLDPGFGTLSGNASYRAELVAPDGRPGTWVAHLQLSGTYPFSAVDLAYTVLAANVPLIEDNLVFHVTGFAFAYPSSSREYRVKLVFSDDIWPEDLSRSMRGPDMAGCGSWIRTRGPTRATSSFTRPCPTSCPGSPASSRPSPKHHSRMSTCAPCKMASPTPSSATPSTSPPSTTSSAATSATPWAANGYAIRAATRAEVEAHYAASRPAQKQTPQRDLSVTAITPLSDIDFDDWKAFGVKAANVAVLGTLGFPDGTVPDGFAVPFYIHDEFMQHNGCMTTSRTCWPTPIFRRTSTSRQTA